MVVLWDHLVGDGLLVLFAEHLLQDSDQGQDKCDGSKQQGFTGDQGDLTDGERQDGGEFDLQQGQEGQQNVLALLLCKKQNGNGREYTIILLRIAVYASGDSDQVQVHTGCGIYGYRRGYCLEPAA